MGLLSGKNFSPSIPLGVYFLGGPLLPFYCGSGDDGLLDLGVSAGERGGDVGQQGGHVVLIHHDLQENQFVARGLG